MSIQRLPDYVVNRLKAGEVVERPYSVLKELVENSLDAGATHIQVNIVDGGMTRIVVMDNGAGIQVADMDMVLERYATSKIQDDSDLQNLASYGFRGEALASISEVSKLSISSKTIYSKTGMQLYTDDNQIIVKPTPVGFDHGTQVIVQDLFYNVPARLKFLKSSQTEYYYCYNYFLDIALVRYDIHMTFSKNDRVIFDVQATDSVQDRVKDLFKKDWKENLYTLQYEQEHIKLEGVVGDAMLRFASQDHLRIYVNKRPVQDRIIKKAIMDVYKRQISPGDYPFVALFVQIDSSKVDVNVHPRKLEVKFLDSQEIFQTVMHVLSDTLSGVKVSNAVPSTFSSSDHYREKVSGSPTKFTKFHQSQSFDFNTFKSSELRGQAHGFDQPDQDLSAHAIGDYQLVGQMWDMYIVLQDIDAVYYMDQHALAERIAFEKMKKKAQGAGLQSHGLLHPLRVEIGQLADVDSKIVQLQELGWDVSLLGEHMLVVYAVPQVFIDSVMDLEKLLEYILPLEEMSYDGILDVVYAMQACKTSIKAGQKLSRLEMIQLVKDGFTFIEGMFVCQHGRPFFVRIAKKEIDTLVGR